MTQHRPSSAIAWSRLLDDATGLPQAESLKNKHVALARILSEYDPARPVSWRTVEKWFARSSMPGGWLVRIAAALKATGRPIDVASYASD